MKTLTDAPFLDLQSADYANDPMGTIRPIARESWLARTAFGGLVVRREQAQTLLKDRRLRASMLPFLAQQGITEGPVWERMQQSLLALDGADHSRLRRLLAGTFTARVADSHRPLMRQVFSSVLDPVLPAARTEFMSDIAEHYPIRVICELLGIPQKDHEAFAEWNRASAWVVSFDLAQHHEEAEWGVSHMMSYVRGLIDERREHPRDDLVTALVQTEDGGERLTDAELRSTIGDLLLAGAETTTNQLGMAMWLFCRHPKQWDLLRERPELVPQAVEEVLRVAGTVRIVPRLVPHEIELDGYLLPGPGLILISTMAANHDPALFTDPQRFDITAERPPQMSFGAGEHFCLGAALARAELQEALLLLTHSMAHIDLEEEATWQPPLGTFGPRTLPLSFRPATAARSSTPAS